MPSARGADTFDPEPSRMASPESRAPASHTTFEGKVRWICEKNHPTHYLRVKWMRAAVHADQWLENL